MFNPDEFYRNLVYFRLFETSRELAEKEIKGEEITEDDNEFMQFLGREIKFLKEKQNV